jgi:hypothetical protein
MKRSPASPRVLFFAWDPQFIKGTFCSFLCLPVFVFVRTYIRVCVCFAINCYETVKCLCSPTILDLDTRWRWVVSFMPRPLYPRGNRPWYPLGRWLGRPQSRSGRCREEKNLLPLPGIEPRLSSPHFFVIPTERTRHVGCRPSNTCSCPYREYSLRGCNAL